MQSLSMAEREAMRAERLAEREARLESGDIKVSNITITIPVGTMIVKSSSNMDGTFEKASFSELKEGTKISIWKNEDGSVKVVKIKGLQ